MSERVSIQFEYEDERSVVLFSHWGGIELVRTAIRYARELEAEVGNKSSSPLDRLEPSTVLVDFIRHITRNLARVSSHYYLGATSESGDNSDNGHHIITLVKTASR